MRVGVISDTHGLLRAEALSALEGVEHIIHAGDIGNPDIVPGLGELAPVTAIRGNVDTQPWAEAFPPWEVVTLAGRTVYVTHDRATLEIDPVASGFDMIISGHSHRARIEIIDDIAYLNPGSAGPRRFRLPVTLALVDMAADVIRPELHELVG